jgi:DNA repair exonuclease SbcCD nuclease subunit
MDKICLIGDTHFSRKAEHPLIKKNIKEGQLAFFDYLIGELNERNIKTVLFTGDIHDTRQSINVEALVNTKRLFQTKMKDFDIHIILGNHDMYHENAYDITALELFEDIPNVTVYRKNVTVKTFLNKKWYIFPWIIADRETKVVEFLNKMSGNSRKVRDNTVMFGHFEMFGINMEGKSVSTFGLDPNLYMNAAAHVFSGHYHGQSITEKGSDKLIYLGSPYPMTFANADQSHGVWILDEDMNMEYIENTISPNFKDIWDTDDIDAIESLENSFVRLHICDTHSKEEEFEIRLKIENKKPILIRTMPYSDDRVDDESKPEEQREANQIMKMNTVSLSEIYMEQNTEDLPKLKLQADVKAAIMNQINIFDETINS